MQQQILIVEDSLFICKTVQKSLAKNINMGIQIAHSLEEAMELVEKSSDGFFVALLDLNLPDAPNGEIIDYISLHEIPFIIFTGNESLSVKEMCEQHPKMIDYVNKQSSFSIDYLSTLINRLQKNQEIETLVVDDSAVSRMAIIKKLRRTMLKTHQASTAQEALDILNKPNHIRLIMIDTHMPDMPGFDLSKLIRDNPANKDISIIGFSADGDNTLAARFLKSGANDYMTKNCSQEELLCRIIQNLDMQDYIRAYKDASNKDFLTGLYNRRFLLASVPMIEANAKRNKTPFSVAMFDIDHFKNINDTLGHDAGDVVLKALAHKLKSRLRASDLLARIGGEEFCIIAVDADQQTAQTLFEELRLSIEKNVTILDDGQEVRFTASIGVCCDSSLGFEDMLKISDENLYTAKETGRNKIIIT